MCCFRLPWQMMVCAFRDIKSCKQCLSIPDIFLPLEKHTSVNCAICFNTYQLHSPWSHYHHNQAPWAQCPYVSDAIFTKIFQSFLSIAAWLSSWSDAFPHSVMSSSHSLRSSPPVCAVHSPEHQLLNPSVVVYSTYVSEQCKFLAYQFEVVQMKPDCPNFLYAWCKLTLNWSGDLSVLIHQTVDFCETVVKQKCIFMFRNAYRFKDIVGCLIMIFTPTWALEFNEDVAESYWSELFLNSRNLVKIDGLR